MNKFILCALVASVAFFSVSARADYYKLYSPHVEAGELSLEANINYSSDEEPNKDNYLSQVYGVEYGVNDWWMTEIAAEVEKQNAAANKLTNVKWENVISPWRQGQNWLDSALYVELEKGANPNETNNLEIKGLFEKEIGPFDGIVNAGISHNFGSNAATGFDANLEARAAWRLDPRFEPGLEYYGDFGALNDQHELETQSHLLGPAIYGRMDYVKYDVGVLEGVSGGAPDTTIKFNVEYEF